MTQSQIGKIARISNISALVTMRSAARKTMHESGLAYNPNPVLDLAETKSILIAAW